MANPSTDQLLQVETTCGTLLYELQTIWDEVGETDSDRDKMLLELEQECLEVYRRKVDQANRSRAQLRQAIADSEAELASICSALGEPPVHTKQSSQNPGSLKEELKFIIPHLEDMRKRKSERRNRFLEVIEQIRKISNEIQPEDHSRFKMAIDEYDLSTKRLEELQRQLHSLQKEKSDRLKQVLEHLSILNSLCLVLGIDFKKTITEVHPSLDENEASKSISNDTIERLASAIQRFRELKIQRMQKLQDLATMMLELWNLMDTPIEEQQVFQNVTSNIAASEPEITEPNTLSLDFINYVEAEVSRLEELKASKMKELVFKKKTELEELRRRTHLVAESDSGVESAIESGAVDPSLILEQIEAHISVVKEEAFSRKEILERVEKWLAACDEESWLEEYNRDENRYSAGKGAHLILKRAEKARATVNKIPAMVEALSSKIITWENERGLEFTYDGLRLLSMLEEYTIVRQEKELERKRQRDQKKLQGQLIAEQEALFGSKPSPCKPQSAKKMPRTSNGGPNRRLSLGAAAIMQPSKSDLLHSTKPIRSAKKPDDRSVLSHASRGLDVAGLPMKRLSFNPTSAREVETQRKPFTPVAPNNNIPPAPSHQNTSTSPSHQNIPVTPSHYHQQEIPKTPLQNITMTPSQRDFTEAEENMTPKKVMPIPTPKTPMTVSMPMQMATTPAPASVGYEATAIRKPEVTTEYSFEERRLAYYLSRRD
ncbi:65-kDa microtubule-associated protein 3 [Asparagus officinalis]|nr:65-kDa microtubule-associated protein 3 [Asparagus officinalis]XP_020273616.1 65-kDa microtubule-associated protein 3 [Asparagus officinalis]